MADDVKHLPVMPEEVKDLLGISEGMMCVDGTVGAGGHTRQMLQRIGATGKIIAVDRDLEILTATSQQFEDSKSQMTWVHTHFADTKQICRAAKGQKINACLLDLGVSSFQLDQARRGFSFQRNGPLDMRMNTEDSVTAADIVNSFPESDLADVFFLYGDERYSRRMAKEICLKRKRMNFETTMDLAKCIQALSLRRTRIHPATRVFQALRILINDELFCLADAMDRWIEHLADRGRLAVLSYHSLEDSCVKYAFRTAAREGRGRLIVKKPVVPQYSEIRSNPRARSAKLRVIEVTHS